MISAKWSINLNNNKKVTMQLPMSVVVIYNEFINETSLRNTFIYTHIYTSEDRLNLTPEKFIAHLTFKMC